MAGRWCSATQLLSSMAQGHVHRLIVFVALASHSGYSVPPPLAPGPRHPLPVTLTLSAPHSPSLTLSAPPRPWPPRSSPSRLSTRRWARRTSTWRDRLGSSRWGQGQGSGSGQAESTLALVGSCRRGPGCRAGAWESSCRESGLSAGRAHGGHAGRVTLGACLLLPGKAKGLSGKGLAPLSALAGQRCCSPRPE